jgi:nucleoside-diphosphate-sugar epimerase
LVTDAAGGFAQALLPRLCGSDAVEMVTGLDGRSQSFAHPKYHAVRLEPADAAATAMLKEYDVVIHIPSTAPAALASPGETVDAQVRPVHKFFQAAHAAGVRQLIHLSSAAVYGPAVHANEQSPLRPLPGFSYAEQQAHLEQLLAIDFPRCVRLRPHLVVGPHAHPAVRRFLRQPFYPRLGEPPPLFQCVHEDDLADAVLLCLKSEAHGPYNIASDDSFTLRDALRTRRGFNVGLPVHRAESFVRLAARYFRYEIDPRWMQRAAHTVLINCRRAVTELRWRSRYTAQEALAAT